MRCFINDLVSCYVKVRLINMVCSWNLSSKEEAIELSMYHMSVIPLVRNKTTSATRSK